MNKYITLIFSFLFVTNSFAQNLVANDLGDDHMTCAATALNEKYVMTAGYSTGFGFADQEIVFQKTDLNGKIIWSKNISHLGIDEPKDLIATSDTNFLLVGALGKSGGSDLFIMKFDSVGNVLWQKMYTGSSNSVAYEVVEKSYNGVQKVYTVVGSHENVASRKDVLVLILSTTGLPLHIRSNGTIGNDEATGVDIVVNSEDPVLTGYTDFYGTKDIIYTRMDFDGSAFSTTVYDGGKDEEAVDILSTFGNLFQIAGNSNSFSVNGDDDIVFFGFNTTTTTSWFKAYGTEQKEHIYNQINYGGTGVGYLGYYEDALGKKSGLSLFTDWGGNNEGSHQLSSCSSDEVIYDKALFKNGDGVNVASSNIKNGSSDFVLYKSTIWGSLPTHCLASNYNTQGKNQTWKTISQSNDFIARPFVNDSLKDTLITSKDYTLTLIDLCSSTDCNISLDLSPLDTIPFCSNTTLTVVLEKCESILWSPQNITVGGGGLSSTNVGLSKTGWVKATKTKGTCSVTDSVYIKAVYNTTISMEEPLIGNTSYCLGQTSKMYNASDVDTKTWTISVPTTGVIATFKDLDTISYTFSDSLAYTITLVMNDSRCSSGRQITQGVSVLPLASAKSKNIISCTSPATISAFSNGNANIKYLWSSGETSKSISSTKEGQYIVTKTWGGTPCTYKDTINLSFPNSDTVSISSNAQSRCEKDTLKLSLPLSAKSSNWTITNLTNSAVQNLGDSLNLILPLQGGFFRIQNNWTTGCNTSKAYQKNVDVYIYPVFNLEDTAVCGVNPILDPKIASFYTWSSKWNTGETSRTITPNTSGKYILTTTNGPCIYKDSSIVTIRNSTSTITNPVIEGTKKMCLGDTAKFYVPNVGDSVRWEVSINGLRYLRDTIRFLPTLAGTYSIYAYPTEKCEFNGRASTTYTISSAQAGPDIKDTSSCDIQSITYTLPSNLSFYRWSDGTTKSTNTITKTGQYYVEYGNGSCTIIDSFFVELAESVNASYSASKRSNIWIFGYDAGLDFNFDPPKPFVDGKISTDEGCSTICDEYGGLLFYTDGQKVYNRKFVTMPNGTGLLGSSSSTHSSIIVPHPGNKNLYYIFTTGDMENIENKIGLNYSIVDISLQSGFGDVILKNQKLFDYSAEKIAAVESEDGQSIWVVAHESTSVLDDGSNRFFAYNVGEKGLDKTPVISSVGHLVGDFKETNWGQMKISPNGKKLAMGIGDIGLEVFDFNASTGKVSNPWFVDHDGGRVYGVEFSPNSEYVFFGGFAHTYFDQFKVTGIKSENEFINSKYRHYAASNIRGMQLAPDGKVYVIIGYTKKDVSVINNPNVYGAGLSISSVKLNSSATNGWTFPSINTSYSRPKKPFDINYFNACAKDEVKFTTNSIYNNIIWDFGDNKKQTGREVYHKFDSPGLYTIKAKYNAGCDEFTKTIEVSSPASVTVHDSITACAKSTVIDAKNPLDKIYWYKQNSNVLIDSTQKLTVNSSGNYIAKIKHENCIDTSSFKVFLEQEPDLGIDTILYNCFEDESSISIQLGNAPKSYTWLSNNQSNTSLFVTQAGRYLVEVTGNSICKLVKGINVVDQCKGIIFIPNAFTPNGDGLNDDFDPFTKFLTKYEIHVFNQWGELVFVSKDENQNWDGKYKGTEAMEGVYTYVISYSYKYKNEEYSNEAKGFISLIK